MTEQTTILLVDDEVDLLEAVSFTLEHAGYEVLTATDGQKALEIIRERPVSLIAADIAMPGMNGYQLLNQVRQERDWLAIPFIFLSARNLDSDVRFGKELGVDDYLVKPFRPADLLATVQGKLLRASHWQQTDMNGGRSSQEAIARKVLTVGKLRIDSRQHRVWMADQPVSLSAREFRLIEYLAHNAGSLVPFRKLIRVTHGLQTDPADAGSLLRPLVRSLRRKLGYPAGEAGCIENLRGVGYRLLPA